jgi:5-enolpyruvylshikimate-3-phosphate synthase
LRLTLDELVVAGEHAAASCTFRGTHRGFFFGIRATEKPVEFVIITFFGSSQFANSLLRVGGSFAPYDIGVTTVPTVRAPLRTVTEAMM